MKRELLPAETDSLLLDKYYPEDHKNFYAIKNSREYHR